MSWAEVKKFLNKRTDKALNEIIQEYGDKGAVKSVQRGVITIASQKASATATINAVNMSKSELVFTGLMTTSSEGGQSTETNLVLTNATTVTATRGTTSYKTTVEIPYQVVEYY